jgi:hypothetical protein
MNIPPELAPAPTIRLAHIIGAQGDNNLIGRNEVAQLPKESAPSLLISYAYINSWLSSKHLVCYRDWVLDSGAYSAMNSGTPINLADFIAKAKELLASDMTLTEVFALDVIGDWRSSIFNAEKMWQAGIPAIPTYHFLDNNWDVLRGFARDYPKVAVGGMAKLKGKMKRDFVARCFDTVWPKKIHGFGCAAESIVMHFPFHSVDSTSWEMGPCGYGNWRSFGKLVVRGSAQDLRPEVEWYLRLERAARSRWGREMAKLEALPPVSGPYQAANHAEAGA